MIEMISMLLMLSKHGINLDDWLTNFEHKMPILRKDEERVQ